jgi:hypothetical protein
MDPSSTFLFEVVFEDIPAPGETTGSQTTKRSIIVEVEPESVTQPANDFPLEKGEGARQYAKELAPQFAMQVVQKDLPHGFEPPYSVMEIDQLPRDLHHRPAKFHGNRFRAWLL